MIKCGKLEGKDQCILYSKDGSKVLGRFPYSKHGSEKGAKAAAHKREGQIQAFKKKHQGLLDAVEAFGAPVVLKYLLDKAVDCEACQEVVKSYVEKAQGATEEPEEVEKAKKKKDLPYGGSLSKMWAEKFGGSVEKCIKMVGDKVSDPGAYCAKLKDKALKTTKWRGKEKKSFDEVAEEALLMLQKDEKANTDIDLAELEAWLKEAEVAEPAAEEPPPEPAPEPEPEPEPVLEPEPPPDVEAEPEGPPNFVDFLRREYTERRAGILAALGQGEEEVE